MDWRLSPVTWASGGGVEVWHDEHGDPRVARAAWRPDEDDAQSLSVLERLVERGFEARVHLAPGATEVRLVAPGGTEVGARDADRRTAILEAALRACPDS